MEEKNQKILNVIDNQDEASATTLLNRHLSQSTTYQNSDESQKTGSLDGSMDNQWKEIGSDKMILMMNSATGVSADALDDPMIGNSHLNQVSFY